MKSIGETKVKSGKTTKSVTIKDHSGAGIGFIYKSTYEYNGEKRDKHFALWEDAQRHARIFCGTVSAVSFHF